MTMNILRLELLLNRKLILVYLLMVIAVAVIYPLIVSEIGIAFTLGVVYVAMLPSMFLARHAKFKADDSICVLPITRRGFISATYLFVFTMSAVFFALFLLGLIAIPKPGFTVSEVFSADRLAGAILAISIVASILLPFIIRFGYTGVFVFILVLNLLTVVLFLLTSIGIVDNALDFAFRTVPEWFRSMRRSLGTPKYHLISLAMSAAAVGISMLASIHIYSRKEF